MTYSLIAKSAPHNDIKSIIDVAYRKCGGAVYKQDGGFLDTDVSGFLNKYVLGEKTQIKPGTVASKDVLEFVPVIGDAIAAKDIADEINKPNPNWFLVGVLTAGTAVGLIPGVGDAVGTAIKKGGKALLNGSKKANDIIKQYELVIDPNTLGSSLGNVQFRKKQSLDTPVSGITPASQRFAAPYNPDGTPNVASIKDQGDISEALKKSIGVRQSLEQSFDQASAAHEYAATGITPRFPDHKSSAPQPTNRQNITSMDKTDLTPETNPNLGVPKTKDMSSVIGYDKAGRPIYGKVAVPTSVTDKGITTGTKGQSSVIADHMGMVNSFAKTVPAHERDDAIQDGIIALLEAEKTFKPGSNVKFSTYAYEKVKHAVKNRTKLTDPDRRAKTITAEQTSSKLDAPIADTSYEGGAKPATLHDIVTNPDVDTDAFITALPTEYKDLARLLIEKQAIKDQPFVKIDGINTRLPAVKDKEIADALGTTVPKMKELRKELGEYIKTGGKLDSGLLRRAELAEKKSLIYRGGGKSHVQPEYKGLAPEKYNPLIPR